MSETRALIHQLRAAWANRPVRTFTPGPSERMHPRKRARALERIDGLGQDREGRTVCMACSAIAGPGHRCDFMAGA